MSVDVQRYGRYLGNQRHEPATDLSGFKVEYENLAFRNFTVHGEAPCLVGKIDATSSPHTIKGLKLEGLPAQMSFPSRLAGSVGEK